MGKSAAGLVFVQFRHMSCHVLRKQFPRPYIHAEFSFQSSKDAHTNTYVASYLLYNYLDVSSTFFVHLLFSPSRKVAIFWPFLSFPRDTCSQILLYVCAKKTQESKYLPLLPFRPVRIHTLRPFFLVNPLLCLLLHAVFVRRSKLVFSFESCNFQ